MKNKTIFSKWNLSHARSCIRHFKQRVSERFKGEIDEYKVCEIADYIMEGKSRNLGQLSLSRFWYLIRINGKKAIILFDHKLEVPVTVYTTKMFLKMNPAGLVAA